MGKHLTIKQKHEIIVYKEKHEIIVYKEKHTKSSCAALKMYFDKKFKQNIGLRTFTNILETKEKIKARK